ncbi:MAG: HlyD family efflux transporter periplasmic adaptor subunit [Planctomycetota bacterium]|nr:HlyD family efflux transporter periplasmic adaptor subunit [Planctomycetota bacterium]
MELRPDLETSRHVFRGEVSYILIDPLNFASHRFSREDYAILTAVSVDQPLCEIFAGLVKSGELDEEDGERFYGFIYSLHKIGFLNLPISDEKTLYDRHLAKRAAKKSGRLKSSLFFQIPLWQPDAFLSRTARFAKPFFSRFAFAAWIALVVVAGWVVMQNWSEFTAPVGDIFRNENLPLLWVSLIVLKVAHEFGHAYATKLLGGHVPEMGLYMMVFTPCAYVDATAAWGFTRKRDRLIVNFGGMYVELLFAALAVIAWSVMPPGLWRSVMHNVVMLASVITIGFNINPLMRYDGYYALSDYLEIPNLRARSSAEGVRLLKRLVLGLRSPGENGLGFRTFLVLFGLSSAIYKVVLVLGISATIALKFPAVGIALASTYILSEIWTQLRRAIPYLWHSQETDAIRKWAMSLALMIVAGIPLGVAAVPVPTAVRTRGVLSSDTDLVIRAQAPGFLRVHELHPGRDVEENEVLVTLHDLEVSTKLNEVEARLDVAHMRLQQAHGGAPADVQKATERVQQLESERRQSADRADKLIIKSPVAGRIVGGLDPGSLGRFVGRGEPIGTIIAGETVVRALLSEEELVAVRSEPGSPVEFRSKSNPGRVWNGQIKRVIPAGRREFDQSFAAHLDPADYSVNPTTGKAMRSQFEVEVVLTDASAAEGLPHRLTGTLRLTGKPEPLGISLVRKSLTFLRSLTS